MTTTAKQSVKRATIVTRLMPQEIASIGEAGLAVEANESGENLCVRGTATTKF